jgi:hypothetical protein
MINIGSKLDREFRNGVNANFEEADQRLDNLEGGRIADKSEVNSTIATKEAESIARDNEHKNSTTAHAAENITYTGKVTGATNAKQAIEKTDDRISNIVGQTGSSNTEIVDARPSVDGSANATLKNRLDKMEQRQVTQAKQTATLTEPLNVLTTSQATSFDPTVKGRTLANLALNPATEDGKNYVATFPNRNVGLNLGGTYTYANTKFQNTKTVAPVLMADFVGKIAGSTVENPHIQKNAYETTLQSPTGALFESDTTNYGFLSTLNGSPLSTRSRNTPNGVIAQQLFSFNLIEHIERTYGTIPKTTVADKVQWIKENVQRITFSWWGFGSSPTGNKATLAWWNRLASGGVGAWADNWSWHTNGSVTRIIMAITPVSMDNYVNNDGMTHMISYANASDGVTASTINTDYVNLEVELKQTAPTTTVKDDFTGKVEGSTVANPHTAFAVVDSTTLNAPVSAENFGSSYPNVSSLNGSFLTNSNNTVGGIVQHRFSFNLLEAVKRKYGFTPPNVQWLKDNIVKITANWHGFGSSVGGNKANLKYWAAGNNVWSIMTASNTTSSVAKLSLSALASNDIDTNGFVHYLAYAEPSDGTTPSTINTDFIEIELEIKNPFALRIRPTKQTAGLYEVDTTTYNLVNVDTNYTGQKLLDKFPAVVGVQHVQNPAITVQGKNLLPPFTEWTLHANATVKSPYELELNATGLHQGSDILINVLPNQTYTFSGGNGTGQLNVDRIESDGSAVAVGITSGGGTRTFTTSANTKQIRIRATNNGVGTGLFTFTNPQLELGNTATPFEPKNEDVLYAKTVLAGNTSAKDELYKRDGQWYKSKRFENFVLDGAVSLVWGFVVDRTGNKVFKYAGNFTYADRIKAQTTKFNGLVLRADVNSADADNAYFTNTDFYISVSDADSGFHDSYSPTGDETKAYFNGWQVKSVDGANKPTAWKSIVDGSDSPTQTLAYVSTNKATGYTPYQLTYQLATTREEAVQVEGAISLHEGMNQIAVDSGVIVRERVTPKQDISSLFWYINEQGLSASIPDSPLKNKTDKIIAVYKNGVLDKKWISEIRDANTNGKAVVKVSNTDYDPTANYEIAYLVADKQLFTANVTEVIGSYNTNLKTNVDGLTERVADVTGQVSINTQQIINILVRLKAGGL